MKKVKKIALCGMLAALITVICLAAYFPYLTYALPALASVFIIVPLFEIGKKYALFTYLASFLPIALLAENEAKMLYLCFFGFYPILKAIYEGFKSRALEYICKFFTFNFAVVLAYFALSKLLMVEELDFGEFGRYGAVLFLALGNIVFFLYDRCLSRLAAFYVIKLRKHISKFFK